MGGTFYEPTVLADVTSEMLVTQEETFGPLAPVITFKAESDVVAMANDTEYGLASFSPAISGAFGGWQKRFTAGYLASTRV